MTIAEIGQKIDKIYISNKDYKTIAKWVRDNHISKLLDNRFFFPLANFVLDVWVTKTEHMQALVELNNFNPMDGKITFDQFWYTFKHLNGQEKSEIKGMGAPQGVMQDTHIVLCSVMLYIALKGREKKYRVSPDVLKENDKANPYKYQNRVCFLLDDVIEYVAYHPTRKSIQYQCECWGVRGHLRHYTDGRVVFIEPYKKGRLRDTLEPKSKTYMLTTQREVTTNENNITLNV